MHKRLGGAVAMGRLSSSDRSLEDMQWEIVGYARGFAHIAAIGRVKYWESGTAGKHTHARTCSNMVLSLPFLEQKA